MPVSMMRRTAALVCRGKRGMTGMLESVGLAAQDQDIYRTLLLHPDWGIADIQHHLGLPEQEVLAALDRLARLSLLRLSGDAGRFITANPDVELKPVLERMEAELDERRARLSRDRATVAALAAEYTSLRIQSGAQGLERLEGVESVRLRLQELAQNACSEVRAFMPGGALSPGALAAVGPWTRRPWRVAYACRRSTWTACATTTPRWNTPRCSRLAEARPVRSRRCRCA